MNTAIICIAIFLIALIVIGYQNQKINKQIESSSSYEEKNLLVSKKDSNIANIIILFIILETIICSPIGMLIGFIVCIIVSIFISIAYLFYVLGTKIYNRLN